MPKPSDLLPTPPLHNLLMPHDNRYGDVRACPPNCPYRLWVEERANTGSEEAPT